MNMNDQEFELWLQSELSNPEPYIADDGFTEQLMAQLPAAPRRKLSRPNVLVMLAALVSTAIVIAVLPVQSMLQSFASLFVQPSANWLSLVGLGIMMLAASALVVWNDRVRIFEV